MPDFSGRSGAAIVVGGSGGIGAAVAELLSQRASNVALTYHRNRDGALAVVARCRTAGVDVRVWQVDLVDASRTAAVLDEVAEAYGGIHTVVYAAGPHVPMKHLSRVEPAEFRTQIENDVVGFFNLAGPAIAHLRRSRGSLIAVTTAAVRRYPVRDGLSAAPKGAVEAVVRGIAAEEGRYGVRANCVGPGMLDDGMSARLQSDGSLDQNALDVARRNIALRRFGTARDVAEMVCFLASDRAGFVTGQAVDVDGGFGI